MKVRWTIVVEGKNLEELAVKAARVFREFAAGSPIKDEEPIFLDVEPDVIEKSMAKENRIVTYKAWASCNFNVH